jgi:hypothetical protein
MATRVIRDASVSGPLHTLTVIGLSSLLVIVELFATALIVAPQWVARMLKAALRATARLARQIRSTAGLPRPPAHPSGEGT